MTPQELKNSILQLAIQGKLVEQRAEEGTGEQLYREILAEKAKLVKAGKIKKDKPLPEIAEDEKPFEIPEGWIWVRLNEFGSFSSGKTPYMGEIKNWANGTFPWVTSKDMKCKYITTSEMLISENAIADMQVYPPKTLLMVVRSGILKRLLPIAILSAESTINQDIKAMSLYAPELVEYLYWFLKGLEQLILKKYRKQVTTVDSLRFEDFQNMPIPFPPLAEQKRIVAKIEELLPYIDRYEQAWRKLEDFNKRFPANMQKSILQFAIQGKVVEQLPEEGTGEALYRQIQAEKQRLIKTGAIKKEKPLPEITEDEKPFEIPESWKWVRLSEVFDVRDGTHDTPKYVSDGIPLVTSRNLVNGSIDFDTTKQISIEDANNINVRSAVKTGDILFAMIGTIGNPVLVETDRKFCIKNMALFKAIDDNLTSAKYLLFFLRTEQESMKKISNGGVQVFVSLSFLRNYLFPLPPLAEQKRIVAKLEEILPLCEKLER